MVKEKTHPSYYLIEYILSTGCSLFDCSEVAWPPSTENSMILLRKQQIETKCCEFAQPIVAARIPEH